MSEQAVIYVHTGEWPSPSPSIVFVTGTVWGLAHGAQTRLFVRNGSNAPTDEVFRSLTGKGKPDTLEIVRVGYSGKAPSHGAFFRECVKRIGESAKKDTVKAVITRSVGFLPYLFYLKKRYGIPVYLETHDFFTDLSFRTDLKKNLHIRRNSIYERTLIPRLNGLICLTECQHTLYRSFYPDIPIGVAHTGLFDVTRSESRREKQICYVGSLDTHKGVGTVIAALAETVDKDIGALIIGGKNEHEIRQFMKVASLVGVGDRVTITGWIPHSDVGFMMDRCIAGIVPLSDTPFNRLITSPLKILDCFSRSLPVIGSDLPTVREYIEPGKHGILFEPDNTESLAEAIDRFAGTELAGSMSHQVESHAKSFLYTERAEKIITFLDATCH